MCKQMTPKSQTSQHLESWVWTLMMSNLKTIRYESAIVGIFISAWQDFNPMPWTLSKYQYQSKETLLSAFKKALLFIIIQSLHRATCHWLLCYPSTPGPAMTDLVYPCRTQLGTSVLDNALRLPAACVKAIRDTALNSTLSSRDIFFSNTAARQSITAQ